LYYAIVSDPASFSHLTGTGIFRFFCTSDILLNYLIPCGENRAEEANRSDLRQECCNMFFVAGKAKTRHKAGSLNSGAGLGIEPRTRGFSKLVPNLVAIHTSFLC
jgi:hypothetical protein